jgi:hypothetical protein
MTQGKPMEDEETATARYIAGNISTQPMLKSDEPDNYPASLRIKLLELADTMLWRGAPNDQKTDGMSRMVEAVRGSNVLHFHAGPR